MPDADILGMSEDGTMAVLVDFMTDRTQLVTVDGTVIAELEVVGGNWWEARFSPDGRYVATNRTGSIRIWDTATGTQLGSIEEPAAAIMWTPDGSQLILGGMDGIIKVFDVGKLLQRSGCSRSDSHANHGSRQFHEPNRCQRWVPSKRGRG